LSGFGHLFAVPDKSRSAVSDLRSKLEWYMALGGMKLEEALRLDTEHSLQAWLPLFDNLPPVLSRFRDGDFRSEDDGTGDPRVVFIGKVLVRQILGELRSNTELHLLGSKESWISQNMWLLKAMESFFSDAAENDLAVIALWGH